ncbi:MAG: signal peptide peptidase SppA [Alphaproteobacteria bacterium]
MEVVTKEKKVKKSWKRKLFINSMIYSFAVFGLMFLVLLGSLVKMLNSGGSPFKPVPEKSILTIDLGSIYPELRGDDFFSAVSGFSGVSYYDLLKTISMAAYDDRVKVLVADISNVNLGVAQIQNLRQTIKSFRSTGKKAYVYSTGFGNFGGGTGAYYLASAFDEIWMMPNSEIGITGINIEVPFFKELLNKIGVEPEFFTRYEYKNAVASLTGDSFTKEHKEALDALGSGLYENILNEISEDRKIPVVGLKVLVDSAPLYVRTEVENKLIDKIAYRFELIDELKKQYAAEEFSFNSYASNIVDNDKTKKLLAYLVLDGVINSGISKNDSLNGQSSIGSKSVLKQIEDISKDDRIKALVVRVNSPGGSYVASNEIWRALTRLKETKKIPVVVSMGDYAASGGYFIALAGDYVYAEPTTITGSIGVLGGKVSLQKLWEKLGVNWQSVQYGENASALSLNKPFSEKEKALFNKFLDNSYVDFTSKVATERKIALDEVDKLARGRVWLGSSAKKLNLVDGLGGIEASFLKARELSKVDKEEQFGVIYYPKKKTFQEQIAEFMGGEVSAEASRVKINEVLFDLGIDIRDLNMLKRMEYDTILTPMKISM